MVTQARGTALEPAPPESTEPTPTSATSAGPEGALTRLLEELARPTEPSLALPPEATLDLGEIVNRYALIRVVGRGGFGLVYEARDLQLGRSVALKVLKPGRAVEQSQVADLRREAEAAAQLNHPNVVTVHDFGTCRAGSYLVMELLRGEPLSRRLESGPLPPSEAVDIAIGVARALVHAHGAEVVHRDLKPGNVFLCAGGQVKVLDFGLARILGAAGVGGGTPGFMAPEQRRGGAEDERTDLFGLGVLLFRMLTGAMPYPKEEGRPIGARTIEARRRVPRARGDSTPAPAPQGDGIPERVGRLVQRLVEKDPKDRPPSAQAALDELSAIARAIDPERRKRRRRAAVAALALLAIAGSLVVASLWARLHGTAAVERVTVAVADFSNETGQADLEGLSAMLITSLEQSKRLSVLTRSRMRDELRKLGHADVARIDETLARELGRATGTRALLLGSLRRFDNVYAVELRALDPAKDEYLFTVSERVERKDGVPALLDRVAERTRRELREPGEELAGSRRTVSQTVTADLAAYQHYFAGVECMDRRVPLACVNHFEKAIAADPGFALAYYQLSFLSGAEGGDPTETQRWIAGAVKNLDRVPDKERELILAWKLHVEGKDDEALSRYEAVLSRYPEEKRVLYLAGDLLHHRGDLRRALGFFERVLALDPTFEWALDHVVNELGALGRRAELAERVHRFGSSPPTPPLLHALVRAHVWLGDATAALRVAQRARDLRPDAASVADLATSLMVGGDFAAAEREILRGMSQDDLELRLLLSRAQAAQGRRAEALRSLQELEPLFRSRGSLGAFHIALAQHHAGDGDVGAVFREARHTIALDPSEADFLAVQLAYVGDAEQARQLASSSTADSIDRKIFGALAAWRRGDSPTAARQLRALDALNPTPEGAVAPSFLLTEVAASAGSDAETVAAAREYLGLWPRGIWSGWAYPRSLYLLARAHERLGQPEKARAAVERLLALWSRADNGLPILAQAKELRARLEPRTDDSQHKRR
jgi:tetratricopeptide (TPR) repeat protein